MATTKTPAATDPLEALREPFDTELITKSDGISNVAPKHYVSKLINSDDAYTVLKKDITFFAFGKGAAAAVISSVSIAGQTFEGAGAFPIGSSKDSKDIANAVMSADSVSLKRAMLSAGVGLELYPDIHPERDEEEEEEDEAPARKSKPASRTRKEEPEDDDEEEEEKPARRSTAKKAPAKRGKWTGEDDCGIGKNADTPWNEVEGSFLQFIMDKFEEGSLKYEQAEKEIDRRGDDFDPEEGKKQPQRKSSNRGSGGKTRAGRFD